MGLCCSFIKTIFHVPLKHTPQKDLEINKKIDDISYSKESNSYRQDVSPQTLALILDPNNIDQNRVCINLFPIPVTTASAYHKSAPKSLNLENESSPEKDKIDTKKSNTISLLDSNKESSPENASMQRNKESETSFKIQKEDLLFTADMIEKINKIIHTEKSSPSHKVDKGKSFSMCENDENANEIDSKIKKKDEKDPLKEEKQTNVVNNNNITMISPKEKETHVKQPKKQETIVENSKGSKQNILNQNPNANDNIKKKQENLQIGRTTETTIKTSDKNIIINFKDVDVMTEKPGHMGELSEKSPKKSLLKYKTIGDERKKSINKKNVKFKGISSGVVGKKQKNSNQKGPIK